MKYKLSFSITLVATLTFFTLAFAPLTAQAIGISIYNANTHQADIEAWITGLGGQVSVVEDFEGETPGWYQTLGTAVGTFRLNDSTQPGTGTTSFKKNPNKYSQTGLKNGEAYFEIRGAKGNGRFNTTPDEGTHYLDSADITSFTLDVVTDTYTNLFFYMTDPSDVKAKTSIRSYGYTESVDYQQKDGSLWFIGINLGTEYISQITWDVTYNNEGYTNDGFGLDGFSTVSVPEPMALLLIGSGLLGLGVFRRSRK